MRSRFAHLLRKMSEDRGKRITLQEVADATGLNINTLSRWSQPKTMQKVDVETAYALVQYFNCTLDELLEFVHPNAAVK